MDGKFRQRLLGRELLLGTMLSQPCPAVADILAGCGFDWLFVDGEHGPFDLHDIERTLQAVAGRAACLVRVPGHQEAPIKQALDLGADGIIVPQVNTAAQARSVVSFARYAPCGIRGVGLARAHGYGRDFQDYVENANDRVSVVVQAEHIDAARNIRQIVAVEGVDAVLIGPYDLSASLGKTGQLDDPSVKDAIAVISDACSEAGKPLGIFGLNAAAVSAYKNSAFTLLVAGVDTIMLGQAAQRLLEELRS